MTVFRPILLPLAGFTEVDNAGEHVYKRASDGRLFHADMTPLVPYTAKEEREIAYETLPLISFDGKTMTVDEAATMFWHYYPDSSRESIVEELKEKISEAKDHIRELYPDESTPVEEMPTEEE